MSYVRYSTEKGEDNEHGVDSSVAKGFHAVVVVQAGIDTVDTERVHAQILKIRQITGAGIANRKRVDKGRRLAKCVIVALNNGA